MLDTKELEIIQKEKERLREIVAPAIKQFVDATGLWPEITWYQTSEETRCGTVTHPPVVTIKAYL